MIPCASPNHSSRGGHPIRLVILHATAGSAASALGWLCNPASKVSAHYLIDKAGRIYALVEETLAAWHAGRAAWQGETDINAISIGIELENANTGTDPYPPAQLAAAAGLCCDLCRRYGLGPEALLRHLDVAMPRGRKSDPAGLNWPAFVAQVTAAVTLTPAAPIAAQARSAAWVRSSAWQGAHVGDLAAGQSVAVTDIVRGSTLTRTGYGTSDAWAQLATGGYVWLPQLRLV